LSLTAALLLELLATVRRHVCVVTRLQLDAALHKPAIPRRTGQRGRSRLKGSRLPTLRNVLASKKGSPDDLFKAAR
jgi:hypothetical protein